MTEFSSRAICIEQLGGPDQLRMTQVMVGDRAAYASQPPGSYCELRVMPAKCVCKLPDAISFETGAAMMLKGLTAQYLLKRTLPQGGLQPGDFLPLA